MKFRLAAITWLEAVQAVGFGALSALAFPPIGLWPLSLLACCLLLLLLRRADTDTARNLGLVYGLAYGAGTLYWFFGIFAVVAIPLIAIFAAYFGLLCHLIAMTRGQRPLVRAALIGMFVAGIEWLRGDAWYLRFPWYTIPHALAQAPEWIASVRWLGTYGFSFLIWMLAAWGALGNRWIWTGFIFFPLFALLLGDTGAPDRRALLLQIELKVEIGKLVRSAEGEKEIDLAVMPEYAYHASTGFALSLRDGPASLAKSCACPVVFGATEEIAGTDDYYNVAVVINSQGQVIETFPKQRPVPLFKDGRPGNRRPVIPVDDGILGVGVCYDFDAPEVAGTLVGNGATVLVAPTFDAMSWGRTQHVQHELLARLRAVENDRWFLRAASSGRSEAIDPHGRPSAAGIEIDEVGVVAVDFAHRNTFALGGRLYWLGPAAMTGTVLYVLVRAGWWLRSTRFWAKSSANRMAASNS